MLFIIKRIQKTLLFHHLDIKTRMPKTSLSQHLDISKWESQTSLSQHLWSKWECPQPQDGREKASRRARPRGRSQHCADQPGYPPGLHTLTILILTINIITTIIVINITNPDIAINLITLIPHQHHQPEYPAGLHTLLILYTLTIIILTNNITIITTHLSQ